MESPLAHIPPSSQSQNFPHGKSYPGSCKHCGHQGLYLREQGPHIALLCSACKRWQKWVRRSKAKRYQREKVDLSQPLKPIPAHYQPVGEQVRADFHPLHDNSHKSCSERLEKIERELTVVVRAVLACGVLSGNGTPPAVKIEDGFVDKFVREVSEYE